MSLQLKRGEKPDPQKVKTALLATATPCNPKDTDDQSRCLMGKLNIPDAIEFLLGETMSEELDLETVETSGCGCGGNPEDTVLDEQLETTELKLAEVAPSQTETVAVSPAVSPIINQPNPVNTMSNSTNFVTASETPSELEGKNLAYALGLLGYDFGSEARRDSFKQLMPGVSVEGTMIPANPYDARQMVDYLGEHLPEAKALI